MIIHILDLGSFCFAKICRDEEGYYVPARSAFIVTTGFSRASHAQILSGWTVKGHKIRRCWSVPGAMRFNVTGFPRARKPNDLIGLNALTDGLHQWEGQNRLLLRRAVGINEEAEAYLVAVRSETFGRIDFLSDWRTAGVRVVCASANKGLQESLIIMPIKSTITTDHGTWHVKWRIGAGSRKVASLELVDEVIYESESEGR
jgi:hypothetical protein